MAKDQNKRRQQKAARRRRRDTTTQSGRIDGVGDIFQPGGLFSGGFQSFEALDDEEFDLAPPGDEVLDTSRCPVSATCQGCGSVGDLHAVTAAFTSQAGEWDVACATLCDECDGRSFITLLGPAGTQSAVNRHATHAA